MTAKQWDAPPEMRIDPEKQYHAVLHTNKGDVRIRLFAAEAPRTVNNFVFLAEQGFYDGVAFHRVIKEFVIQGGDPTGTGSGGPGYRFADELPPAQPYGPGILAMANAGPNTNGSQFFVCTGAQSAGLNQYPNYTVFGSVEEGMEVVQAIAGVPVGPGTGGREMSSPREKVFMQNVTIESA